MTISITQWACAGCGDVRAQVADRQSSFNCPSCGKLNFVNRDTGVVSLAVVGSGALASGPGARAVGAGGMIIGGSVHGGVIITGNGNRVGAVRGKNVMVVVAKLTDLADQLRLFSISFCNGDMSQWFLATLQAVELLLNTLTEGEAVESYAAQHYVQAVRTEVSRIERVALKFAWGKTGNLTQLGEFLDTWLTDFDDAVG